MGGDDEPEDMKRKEDEKLVRRIIGTG